MAFSYGFYNSVNGDRKYDADQMSAIFDGVIRDGVFSTIGNIFDVKPGTGLQVTVDTGKAWFNHTWNYNDSLMPLNLDAPDIYFPRIDAVVIEVNRSVDSRTNTIKIIKGTPASTPQKPALSKEEPLYQYALAYVTVPVNATSIASGNIEKRVGRDDTPFVTGILQSVDITTLFNQFESEFDAWFANVQAQLEGDIVTNLQKQIDDRVKIADKATDADFGTSPSDSKWVTPKMFKQQFQAESPIQFSFSDIPGKSSLYPFRKVKYKDGEYENIRYRIDSEPISSFNYPTNTGSNTFRVVQYGVVNDEAVVRYYHANSMYTVLFSPTKEPVRIETNSSNTSDPLRLCSGVTATEKEFYLLMGNYSGSGITQGGIYTYTSNGGFVKKLDVSNLDGRYYDNFCYAGNRHFLFQRTITGIGGGVTTLTLGWISNDNCATMQPLTLNMTSALSASSGQSMDILITADNRRYSNGTSSILQVGSDLYMLAQSVTANYSFLLFKLTGNTFTEIKRFSVETDGYTVNDAYIERTNELPSCGAVKNTIYITMRNKVLLYNINTKETAAFDDVTYQISDTSKGCVHNVFVHNSTIYIPVKYSGTRWTTTLAAIDPDRLSIIKNEAGEIPVSTVNPLSFIVNAEDISFVYLASNLSYSYDFPSTDMLERGGTTGSLVQNAFVLILTPEKGYVARRMPTFYSDTATNYQVTQIIPLNNYILAMGCDSNGSSKKTYISMYDRRKLVLPPYTGGWYSDVN